MVNAARQATNNAGARVVLECSGYGPVYEPALQALRTGGDLVAIGEHADFHFNPSDQVIRRSLSIIGSWYSTMPQAAEVMQLALSGQINLKSFLTHTISLEEIPAMFKSIMELKAGIMKCVVVIN